MRCPSCGQENPAQYRFCGMCGKVITPTPAVDATRNASLREVPVASSPSRTTSQGIREEISRQETSRNEEVPFTGPSFLGLSGGPSSGHAEYLLDDEASSSGHGRMYVALILLVIAGGLLGWRWYYGGFPWQRASAPAAASSAQTGTAPPNNAANRPATPNLQTPAPQAAPSTAASGEPNTQNPATNSAIPQAADSGEKSSANPSPDASSSGTSPSPDSSATTPATPAKADGAEPAEQTAEQTTPASEAPPVETKKTAPAKPASARTAKRPINRAAISEDDSSASEGEALLTQGERYLYGTGVPQNCGRAESSLEAAAAHGNNRALSDLGSMYSTGHCVRRDLPTAYRWFVKALHQEPANNRISTDLQVLWNQMTPEEKQAAMKAR